MQTDAPYRSEFSPNEEKYGPENSECHFSRIGRNRFFSGFKKIQEQLLEKIAGKKFIMLSADISKNLNKSLQIIFSNPAS